MKKTVLLLSVITCTLLSCANKGTTINGDFQSKDFDTQLVYLQSVDMLANDIQVLDSATVADGKFTFDIKSPEKPELRIISLTKLEEMKGPPSVQHNVVIDLILEKGVINVVLGAVELSATGTPLNDEYSKTHTLSNEVKALMDKATASGAMDAQLMEKIQSKLKKSEDLKHGIVKNNMDNPLGEFLFVSILRSLEDEEVEELLSKSSETFRNKEQIKGLSSELEAMKKHKASTLNQPYKDAKVYTTQRKEDKLSNHIGKGKYVFLDFWASWCQPCIQEMPYLTKTYAQYKDKGFEIVAVSLDRDIQSWENAIKEHSMTWTQLIDTDAIAATTYGVKSIPYTLLIDPSGTVIAMNLRGEALGAKLKEIIKQ